MERKNYEEKPLTTEEVVSAGVRTTVMRFGIEETEDGWECDESCFNHKEPLTRDDYGKLVTHFIREKYSSDDEEAIRQNYLESKTNKHKAEFAALKGWRERAKAMARTVLGIED